MNLQISEVHTQVTADNLSDDDVIEVVRDEAPIEILSDGEETELQNKNLNQLADVIKDFHFTSVPSTSDSHGDQSMETEDPLANKTGEKSTDELCEAITTGVNNMKTTVDKSNENEIVKALKPDISKISLDSTKKINPDPPLDTTDKIDNIVPETVTKESG
ncbi:uncharacterized protein LOC114362979 [Ostrinia furnacalis]|uniref:uncharacterized protein LOC114362979 n=1 Tax=Ostrinia furnacalis TaxID=93504 RepID=UPI00103E9333|nr:uncharacterized protein LOC114362979 [Ostrinia furnacalis]